jgi:hypothetical protein
MTPELLVTTIGATIGCGLSVWGVRRLLSRSNAGPSREVDALLEALEAADPGPDAADDVRAVRDLRRMSTVRTWLFIDRIPEERKVALIRAGFEPAHARRRDVRKLPLDELEAMAALRGSI